MLALFQGVWNTETLWTALIKQKQTHGFGLHIFQEVHFLILHKIVILGVSNNVE